MTAAAPGGTHEGLMAMAVSALMSAGRVIEADWELETFEVARPADDGPPTVAVVRTSTPSVVFYAVFNEVVPADRLADAADFCIRANTELSTTAFELNPVTGILAIRGAVLVAGIPVTGIGGPGSDRSATAAAGASLILPVFGALLTATLTDVEDTYTRYHGRAAALLAPAA